MTEKIPYNEQALLKQVAEGSEQAFTILFEAHRKQLFVYLVRVTKSPELAEDILIDIFLKLWVGRELLTNIYDLEGFLHKVAYNKAMDFFKTTARQEKLLHLYLQRSEQSPAKRGDELLIDAECERILQEAINQLPPKRKQIYRMSREQGLSHEQIAEALHLSRSTVSNTIVSATRSISEYLQKNYPGKTALSCLFML